MSTRIVLLLACILVLTVSALGDAVPLASFDCQEITGRDWLRTLVSYPVQFAQGQVRVGAVRVVDAQGQEQPCQFWRVVTFRDGSIKSARLSFYATLPKGGTYHFELLPGKPAKLTTPPTITSRNGFLTLDNGLTAIRLPGGRKTFTTPLAFCADHAKAAANYANLEKAGIAFGPIAGVRLADGKWVGGSYFAYEPIDAVRFREDYVKQAPDQAAWERAAKAAPKVTGCVSTVIEQGPLFVEARVKFTLDNGGYYQLTARVLADDPAIRLDEMMELKTNCPPDDPLYVVMSLTDGTTLGGWRPDALYVYAPQRKGNYQPLEQALVQQGFKVQETSLPVGYDKDENVLTDVVPLDPFGPRAQYLGLVNVAQLQASKTAPFLAIVPQHAGSWRGAHWVFPPKNPHMFQQLLSYQDGDLVMRWTIRSQPHSQDVLHTGEFDPDFGLTGMRRLWCLVGGPFQYHDTLFPLRANEGFVNLDNYKDWNLAWSDDTRAGGKLPVPPEAFSQYGPVRDFQLAFYGDGGIITWYSHYRQSENMAWAVEMRKQLVDPTLSAERKGQLRAQLAAFCYMMSEPDFNTRASMSHQGNPNMPINRFFAFPFAAVLIPDHPLAKRWMDVSAAYDRYKLGMNTAPHGTWSELVTYYAASAPTLVHGALVAREANRLDPVTERLAAMPVEFTLKLLAPKDPRFGARLVPGFGHEGVLIFNQWLPGAALLRDSNPELAAAFAWAWDQQGRPMGWQHDNGFSELTAKQADLLEKVKPAVVQRELASTWLPGFGAVLRAHATDPNETYLGYRQGYLASHSDANQDDFTLYAKGAPLVPLSLFGYAISQQPEYIKVYNEFGWHSRVRFGKQSDFGGWPGGGPVSGVERHFFSDSLDYLRGIGDYGPVAPGKLNPETVLQRWTRQVLFLKGKSAAGPNYFVFRDSFHNLDGKLELLQQTWWYLRTLGAKEQVNATATDLNYTSEWGPRLNVHFLQPAQVAVESRQVQAEGPMYAYQAREWRKTHGMAASTELMTVKETMTINAVGPLAPGQDVLVVLYPQGKDEAAPAYQPLADGAVKITTSEGADYVFASRAGMHYAQGDVSFTGIAGAVRVYPTEVHLVIAEGAGTVSYQGFTLKSGVPVTKIVPLAEISNGVTVDVPAPKTTLTFALDANAGKIEQVTPGVRKQTLANGVAYEFAADTPFTFAQDDVTFTGARGGLVVDTKAGTVRAVLLDGEKIGYKALLANVASGPYDVTFYPDHITGSSEGPARFLHLTMPAGLVQLPALTINGVSYAPGTHGDLAIVPLDDGHFTFTLENRTQPPVFRSWQQW